jgi:transcriptional regulator with XRE-family HTH domain
MKSIRQLREEREWSQFELAVRAGVTPGTVGNWERGKTEPKASQLRQLAAVFGVPMDMIEFANREEEPEGKVAA